MYHLDPPPTPNRVVEGSSCYLRTGICTWGADNGRRQADAHGKNQRPHKPHVTVDLAVDPLSNRADKYCQQL